MAQIFPKWTNKLGIYIVIVVFLIVVGITAFFTYYGSPEYREMGFQPNQPVPYSHKLHAGDLGMDCRYCHYDIELSPVANIPATQICMNCHRMIGLDKPSLDLVRSSWSDTIAIRWVRVHQLPDFVFFNHASHLRAGVGCYSCHGDVRAMIQVIQARPLNMKWCLDCHRNPQMNLRPQSELTNMHWNPPQDQIAIATKMMADKNLNPPTECSGCHR